MSLKMSEKAISAERTDKHHDKFCVDFGKTPIETIKSMEKEKNIEIFQSHLFYRWRTDFF